MSFLKQLYYLAFTWAMYESYCFYASGPVNYSSWAKFSFICKKYIGTQPHLFVYEWVAFMLQKLILVIVTKTILHWKFKIFATWPLKQKVCWSLHPCRISYCQSFFILSILMCMWWYFNWNFNFNFYHD